MLATAADVRLAIPNGDLLDSALVDSLLAAADAAAKSYMRRDIELATYVERVKAARVGHPAFFSQYPVTAVTNIAVAGTEAMDVWNGTATRASFSVTDTGLSLRSFASGAWTSTTLAFTTYKTLTTLKNAIAALSGWDAALSNQVTGEEPSDELAELLGPVDVSASNHKKLYLMDEVIATDINYERGSFRFTECGAKECESVLLRYSAGYATVPSDIKQAVAMLAAEIYGRTKVNGSMKAEKLGDYAYTLQDLDFGTTVLTPTICKLLGPHCRVIA